ncbi:hypothetical protein EBU71_00655 [bacterium]|nr:hypothetical protein [Candidatus Elulimicrobium humile]
MFQGYTPEISANDNIDLNHASFATANLYSKFIKANVIGTTVVANGRNLETFIQSAFDTANNADSLAQGVYNLANTSAGDITVLQGVNTTQNTNITTATNAATAAFDQANVTAGGLITANARITVTEGVDVTQNSRITIIEGVDTTQNTNITTANNAAQAAFAQANVTVGNLASANIRITAVNTFAQSAFETANNADSLAQGVYNLANTSAGDIVILQGVNTTQNTNITTATTLAQAAFNQANTGGGGADSFARQTANAAFEQANVTAGGLITANSRLTVAEGVDVSQNSRMTIIEGVDVSQNSRMTIIEGVDATQNTRLTNAEAVDVTQNTNITVADTKAQAAFDKANTDHTTLTATAGTYGNTTALPVITLTANGRVSVITTVPITAGGGSPSAASYIMRKYAGNGSTTAFTISAGGHTANTVLVFSNGVCQTPIDDYTVSGTTLTFVVAPGTDETIIIRELPIS